MAHLLLATLVVFTTTAMAGPLPRTPIAVLPITGTPTPAPTIGPKIIPRQTTDLFSYPESGCVYTTYAATPSLTLTASDVCLCQGGTIAGINAVTAGESVELYCAMTEPYATSTPVTVVTDPLCVASKNADTWSQYSMPAWISSQATALAPLSTPFADGIEDMLPGLSANGYSCEWSFGGEQCDVGSVADTCPQNPQAAFAAMAIGNLINYLDDVFQALQTVITTMTPTFATFPDTFNPNNITVMPGTGGLSTASIASYFVGSVAALVPGLGLTQGATAAARLGSLSAVAYMAGSGAAIGTVTDDGTDNIEVQFQSFATIEGLLGQLSKAVSDSFAAFAEDLLTTIPGDGYAEDPRQLPSLLSEGAFAEPHPGFDSSMAQNLTAAIAGPGINVLWQYSGVVVAKVNGNNLPVSPCDGDTLFTADVKYCDADGNMFVLQALPEEGFGSDVSENDNTNPVNYAVPGFNDIGRYNLTAYDIMKSSWENQLEFSPASAGPDAQTFIDGLITDRAVSLPRDDYIFFNLYVCDYDAIDMDDSTVQSMGEDQCGDKTAENAQCWFYFYLAGACPLQFAPEDGTETDWPWGYTWILANAETPLVTNTADAALATSTG